MFKLYGDTKEEKEGNRWRRRPWNRGSVHTLLPQGGKLYLGTIPLYGNGHVFVAEISDKMRRLSPTGCFVIQAGWLCKKLGGNGLLRVRCGRRHVTAPLGENIAIRSEI